MADRTWEERGKWMDGHAAALSSSSTGPVTSYAARAVDAAMDECERLERVALEREAAERAKAKAEQDKAAVERRRRECRSPVAALLDSARLWWPHSWSGGFIPQIYLRTAIEQQCANWRADFGDAAYSKDYSCYRDAICDAYRRCADDLEGKA